MPLPIPHMLLSPYLITFTSKDQSACHNCTLLWSAGHFFCTTAINVSKYEGCVLLRLTFMKVCNKLLQFAGLYGLRRHFSISMWIRIKGYVHTRQCLESQCLLFGTLAAYIKGAEKDQIMSIWMGNRNQFLSQLTLALINSYNHSDSRYAIKTFYCVLRILAEFFKQFSAFFKQFNFCLENRTFGRWQMEIAHISLSKQNYFPAIDEILQLSMFSL